MSGFKSSLAYGHAGESRLASIKPSWRRTDGIKEDFVTPEGLLVELKTESRKSTDTPNIACELASSFGKPGAIERAVIDGIDIIIFLFADDQLFQYKVADLWSYVQENKDEHRTVLVENAGYRSSVLLVPRGNIEHIRMVS